METEKTKKKFNFIFQHKGNIGPISEKARRNFELIRKNEVDKTGRTFYYCVGHTFKNIDKTIFEPEYNEEKETVAPTKFLKLQKEKFTFEDDLFQLLANIRNLNSHYIHTFDCIEISKLNKCLVAFLKEAFHFSVLINYLKENEKNYDDFKTYSKNPLVEYLRDKFFPNKEYQKNEREHFSELNLKEAIDELLFIEVKEDFDWLINNEHSVFPIKEGKYLSFYAQLFLIGLFLYKQEAEQLISKIKGFKRSEDKLQFKRNIFTFFSKKVSSQDIDNEEKYLIRFRDIIQYLNKYPVEWNRHLELKSDFPKMTHHLEKHIIEKEIFRSFPTYDNSELNDKFLKYAITKLFTQKAHLFNFDTINYTQKEEKDFEYEINTSPELKDKYRKLKELKKKKSKTNNSQIKKLQKDIERNKKNENPILIKLKKRIKEEKLIRSYGRNKDRFMHIVIRFLAEENYFGKNVLFKTYQFYTTDEQTEYLSNQKKILSKKDYDKLKYHQGKLVHFTTFENHLKNHPNWDTPFVIENNAFQIKLKLTDGKYQLFSIQRALLPYLLEDALYNKTDIDESNLLIEYFENSLLKDFERVTTNLKEDEISSLHRKLLPSRFLDSYNSNSANEQSSENPFEKHLIETNQQEERYEQLLSKAESLNLKEEFVKKNKGKQFKLRFVRKAWHLMYFKDIYKTQFEKNGHHKGFHITKEEFNDFCKWMFAFDEVPQYKELLRKLLQSKCFFRNKEFKTLFESGDSLESLYFETKNKFETWLKNSDVSKPKRANDYSIILKKNIVYINLSHFIDYLKQQGKLKLDTSQHFIFRSQENIPYLISPWYYKDILPKNEYKTNAKLFNKLRKVKLEDALLYEIAIKYLQMDDSIIQSAKNSVDSILNENITFEIKDANSQKLYDLVVPFNKLETLAILVQHKTEQLDNPRNKKTSFLTNIYDFITNTKEKEIRNVSKKIQRNKQLAFEDLNKVNNHIISSSVKFSEVHMKLEKYFIEKHQIKINKNNYIDIDEIKDNKTKIFNQYYDKRDRVRQKAFHFGVPKKPYQEVLLRVEDKFLKEEVKKHNFSSFEEMSGKIKAVCSMFMNTLHNNLYKWDKKKESQELRKDFEDKYFNEYVMKK